MHLTQFIRPLCVLLLWVPLARAAAPDRDDAAPVLGERFTTKAGGISFCPPLGGKQIKPSSVGTNIVQYINSDESWTLKVSRLVLDQPTPLIGKDDLKTLDVNEVQTKPGILEQTVRQIQIQSSGTRILRQDTTNVGPHDAALIISRFSQGAQTYLRQMALIQPNMPDREGKLFKNDQAYYLFDLTTPSGRTAADKDNDEDASETLAVQIFNAMLDTVQLIDQREILADREDRLYRTRSLYVNLSKRVREAVRQEQYFRIQRQGKDIGWSFIAEEFGQRQNQNGLFVAAATEMTTDPGPRIAIASEAFVSDNRRFETWMTLSTIETPGKPEQLSEVGQSENRITRIHDEQFGVLDPKDPGQPRVRVGESHHLTVTQTNSAGATPLSRDLPPYYLPQALSTMLPRLVPLDQPKGYLFLVWVSSERELVLRYTDVEQMRSVLFDGQNRLVVVIKDHIGLEGDPTFHYFLPGGQYLGSHTPSTGTSIIATDQKTLASLYPEAKITRPRLLDAPSKPEKR